MVEHNGGDRALDKGSEHATHRENAVQEAQTGKSDLLSRQKAETADLKAGGRSGITDQFGKPGFFDSAQENLQVKPQEVAQNSNGPQLSAYHEWELHLKPLETAQSPDGGNVHADSQGRIDRITDVNGKVTTIQYQGDTTQATSIKIAGGATLTWHGNHYAISGQQGQIEAHIDQKSGVITWNNMFGETTRHFPSGGTEDEDSIGRVTSIIDAHDQRTEFEYDGQHTYPSRITLGWATGEPIRVFDLCGDGKAPIYYYSGSGDFKGGDKIAIVPDKNTGDIDMVSLPSNNQIDQYQELPTVQVHHLNGNNDTLLNGDPNLIPEPLRTLMGGTARI